MKKLFTIWFCLGIISISGAQTLRLVGDSWAPFTDQKGSNPGFMVELAGLVLEKAGYKWTYDQIPWARAIDETQAGKADILVAIPSDQAQEAGFVLCPAPYGYNTTDFFTLKTSTWAFKGMTSLKGQTLGTILDYSYTPEIDAYVEANKANSQAVQLSTGENPMAMSLNKLVGGRISVIVDDKSVVLWQARKLGVADKIRSAGSVGSPIPSYLAISPKIPKAKEISDKLAVGLKALKGTPEFQKILNKYGVAPF